MDESKLVYETSKFTVTTFPVEHRIPCVGFLFEEKPYPMNLKKQGLPKDIKLAEIASLKKGEDVLDAKGKVKYRNKELTLGRKTARSYAYCTDTLYIPELADFLQGVDLLYHEATFLTEKELKATNTYHATAGQAAKLALEANAGQLIIGHFSARYKNLNPLQEEARKIFKSSFLAEEGKTFTVEN
jgi:ribonuclease Z